MLSLRELERVAGVLTRERRGARLERAVQHPGGELELLLAGGESREGRERLALLLSCHPATARLSSRPRPHKAPQEPLPFASYLRAHLQGARFRGAELVDGDRQLALRFETREGRFELLLSLLGPRSNVYLLDRERRLLLSLRPLAETRRDLARGEPFRSPQTPPPPAGEDRFAAVSDDGLLGAIEAHYARIEAEGDRDALRRRLRQALKKQRDGIARKQARLQRDLEEAAGAAEARRFGELLKGELSRVEARAGEVWVADPATGERVRVPLDPQLSAAANLERHFKRAKKLERQQLRAGAELGALSERMAEAEALSSALEETADEALPAFAERPELARLLGRYAPAAGPAAAAEAPRKARWKLGKRELPTRLVPRRYRTRDGLEVWVGRNDESNDLLTTRLARGSDLFFHLEGSPGSHVVLRTGRDEPPQESLLEAAELAVHFSKQRGATRAQVHVAAIKDVSKPRGAKPGLVYVHRGRTLALRRDPARLERILEARIED